MGNDNVLDHSYCSHCFTIRVLYKVMHKKLKAKRFSPRSCVQYAFCLLLSDVSRLTVSGSLTSKALILYCWRNRELMAFFSNLSKKWHIVINVNSKTAWRKVMSQPHTLLWLGIIRFWNLLVAAQRNSVFDNLIQTTSKMADWIGQHVVVCRLIDQKLNVALGGCLKCCEPPFQYVISFYWVWWFIRDGSQLTVIHDNTSDHDPIVLELGLRFGLFARANKNFISKPAWYWASVADLDNYRLTLLANLHAIEIRYEAILCRNPLCCNSAHGLKLNNYANDISAACLAAADIALPRTSERRSKALCRDGRSL